MSKPLAIVTGASSGIGWNWLRFVRRKVRETDLATIDGVDQLWAATACRPSAARLS
jgi:hypothetical protein